MKNILGTTENLTLYNKEGKGIYEFKNSNGRSNEWTYDSNGKELTYKDSNGFSSELNYDSNGKELTYKNSDGVSRGFDIGAEWQAERMYSEEDIDKQIQDFKHDLLESTSDSIKQLCSGAILGLNRLKQFKKK